MVNETLALSGLLHVLMAAAFIYVGLRLLERDVAAPFQGPMLGLAAWWLGLGASTVLSATTDLLGGAGSTDLPLFLTFSHLNTLLVVGALAGLMYYLVYLFTGRRALVGVAAFYALVLALSLYNTSARGPSGVELQMWDTDLVFASPDAGVPRVLLFLLALLPPMLGAAAMLGVVPRAPGPTQRFRLVLVGGSILVWFGAVLFAGTLGGLDAHPAYGLAARLLGLGAAAAAYIAYFPPAWARRRWGVDGIRPARGGVGAA